MELNLAEILKNVPEGSKLYSTVCGEVLFNGIDCDVIRIKNDYNTYIVDLEGRWVPHKKGECTLFPSKDNRDWSTFTFKVDKKYKVGDYVLKKNTNRIYKIIEADENVSRYTLKEVATDSWDYSKLSMTKSSLDADYEICDKMSMDDFKPFDRVLIRDDDKELPWRCSYFSHVYKDEESTLFVCAGLGTWNMCIPYNDDTKHLVGTTEDAPEFYRLLNSTKI